MTKITELSGHSSRVLHMAMSPDASVVVSGAADESLKFWKIFDPIPSSSSSMSTQQDKAEKSSISPHINPLKNLR